MAKKFFEPSKLSSESLVLVNQMLGILESYREQGYDLSLRQLYYQLVARNIVPNTEPSYKRVGSVLSDARMCGYVDWDMIVDRGRETTQNSHWSSIGDILDACAGSFRYSLWDDQPWHVEIMVEKQALEGVLEPVCQELDIPFTANKGYSSSSAMYECGKRLNRKLEAGKNICVFYLGDHDPSGIDMTRDVEERLKLFSEYLFYQPKCNDQTDPEWDKAYSTMSAKLFKRFRNESYTNQEFMVQRIALNMDQVREFDPPPNPAKLTDTRSNSYISLYGEESWELDALEPSVLADLVETHVIALRDEDLWDAADAKQDSARETLRELAVEHR